MAVEKFSIKGAQSLAALVHQSDKNVRVVLLIEGNEPLRTPLRVHCFALAFEEGQQAQSLAQGNRCIIATR